MAVLTMRHARASFMYQVHIIPHILPLPYFPTSKFADSFVHGTHWRVKISNGTLLFIACAILVCLAQCILILTDLKMHLRTYKIVLISIYRGVQFERFAALLQRNLSHKSYPN